MAYCTNADVQAEFKSLTFNATNVSTTKVDEWIDQATGLIDSMLSARYTVPITGTTALEIVKMINIWLVADRIRDILVLQPGAPKGTQEFVQDYWKKAMDLLEQLRKGEISLVDAPSASTTGGVAGTDYPNQFKRGVEQW